MDMRTHTTESPDYAAELAVFLLDKTGTIYGTHAERMSADEQRALFGRYLGRGRIVIDGATETICNRVTVAFGQDYDDRNITAWRDLQAPADPLIHPGQPLRI